MTESRINGKRVIVPVSCPLNITFPVPGQKNDLGGFRHQTFHGRGDFSFPRINVTIIENPQKGLFPAFPFQQTHETIFFTRKINLLGYLFRAQKHLYIQIFHDRHFPRSLLRVQIGETIFQNLVSRVCIVIHVVHLNFRFKTNKLFKSICITFPFRRSPPIKITFQKIHVCRNCQSSLHFFHNLLTDRIQTIQFNGRGIVRTLQSRPGGHVPQQHRQHDHPGITGKSHTF